MLSDGIEFDAEHDRVDRRRQGQPRAAALRPAAGPLGRVICNEYLQVDRRGRTVVADAWAAGDCAAVPGPVQPRAAFCPPNAQHALREGNHIGDNLALVLRSGAAHASTSHRNVGAVASLGMYKGVAQMFGKIKVRGLPRVGAAPRRTTCSRCRPVNRKLRIAAGWTGSLLLRREVVALGSLHDPRAEFRAACRARRRPKDATGCARAEARRLPPQKAEKDSPAGEATPARPETRSTTAPRPRPVAGPCVRPGRALAAARRAAGRMTSAPP